jgi:hypothetical protein
VDIHGLLAGSQDPRPDIAFLWTAANDSQYNRYECEMQQIAGALERLGYEPNFMDLDDLAAGVYTNYRLVILPRNMRVDNTSRFFQQRAQLPADQSPPSRRARAGQRRPAGMQDFNGRRGRNSWAR